MNKPFLTRRELNRLALAALGGLASGAVIGCGPTANNPPPSGGNPPPDKDKTPAADLPRLLQDPHVCRGINTCKNDGKKGTTNDCAGQGHCATIKAHSCKGTNDCKGQGGCDDNPGENDCKGKGNCAVPLDVKKGTWKKARDRFVELMKKNLPDKKVGDAPAADA